MNNSWQHQFHDNDFQEEAFLDMKVLKCKLIEKKNIFDFLPNWKTLVKSNEYDHYWKENEKL